MMETLWPAIIAVVGTLGGVLIASWINGRSLTQHLEYQEAKERRQLLLDRLEELHSACFDFFHGPRKFIIARNAVIERGLLLDMTPEERVKGIVLEGSPARLRTLLDIYAPELHKQLDSVAPP
jgi:hypothetical protein